jgi:hypothetical protein
LGDEEIAALSDERGWVEGRFRAVDVPEVLVAEAEAVRHARLLLPMVDAWRDPGGPDLVDSQELIFQAGRISQVFISVDPSVLYGEPGARADVHVRLLDRGGRTVSGESISITASEGLVETPRPLADGSFVARYRPPSGLAIGNILLSAEGGGGHFAASTTLQIIPRPQRFGIGLGVGYLQGFRGVSGPALAVDLESKLKWLDGLFQFRGGFMTWQDRSVVLDKARNKEIEVQLSNFGLGFHLLARRERDARSGWVGLGAMVAPFSQTARFEGMPPISGWGIHRPGIVLTAGSAFRALSGELYGEARWVGMNGRPGEFGYEGSVGGIAVLFGYRVIL